MATNPVPIVVPCHRVVGSADGLGGFSAIGGLATKRRMLALEAGSSDERSRRSSNQRDATRITRHVSRAKRRPTATSAA
jgi:hypothetical protein